MVTAIYPGSFDPVTRGHLDIIERASATMEKVIVAVLRNGMKNPVFTVEERVKLLQEETSHLENVEIDAFDGLLVDYAKRRSAKIIIRGLRAVTDFEYELQMSQTNRKLAPDVDTLFFTTSLEYAYLSSSIVREVAYYGGDVSNFVPDCVAEKIYEKFR